MELAGGSILLLVGLLLLAGYASHVLGKRIHVPRVTLLMVLGIVSGPYGLDLASPLMTEWFPTVAHVALAMVGFLLGESFVGSRLKKMGRVVLWVSLGETLLTAVVVFVVVLLISRSVVLALLLAGIAPASAPAATVDIIEENHAHGMLTSTVLSVVAIDDAWGIILFSLLLAAADVIVGQGNATTEIVLGLWDVGGAVMLGALLGFPMAWVTGRLQRGEPALLEAAGFVFVCGGLATLLNVSYLLACIVLGGMVANRAKHYTRPFHAIEGVSDPFLAVFFILAGYQLEFEALPQLGLLGFSYVIGRATGLILGGRLGAFYAKAPLVVQQHVGWCLLPQAGVALGLVLLTYEKVPEFGKILLPLVIATTVIFELVGPLFTQRHLRMAGEL